MAGDIKAEEAKKSHWDLVNRHLQSQGLIDYVSTQRIPLKIRESWTDYLRSQRHDTEALRRSTHTVPLDRGIAILVEATRGNANGRGTGQRPRRGRHLQGLALCVGVRRPAAGQAA